MTDQRMLRIIAAAVVLLAVAALLMARAGAGRMPAPWPTRAVASGSPSTTYHLPPTTSSVPPPTGPRLSFHGFWIWIAAFLTLCVLSFLYRDNPFYKFAEHLFIGVSAAYWMVLGFWTVIVPNLIGRLAPALVSGIIEGVEGNKPQLFYIIPLILGVLLVARLIPRFGPYSRWSLAFIVGATAGLNFVQYLKSDFMEQIASSIVPLVVVQDGVFSAAASLGNIVLFVGVFCGLLYFFFSLEHKGAVGVMSRIGIWILMISFGASFGFTVMGRIALLVGRMEFLFGDWLKLM